MWREVNGERIDAPLTLDLGDVVRMGRTVLEVRDRSGAVPEKLPPPADEPPSVPAGAGAELVVTAGTAAGRRLSLKDELVIGRAVAGDGRLSDDHELSRRHARLARDAGGQLTIEDLGSANGTFVNGERLAGRQVLNIGDSVRIGSTVAINPGSEYGDGVLCGAILDLDRKRGVKHYQLPAG